MEVHNLMEEIVTKHVNKLYDQMKEANQSWLTCDCENCRIDTISYVLNRVAPRYVVSGRGVNHLTADLDNVQFTADLDAVGIEGIRTVSATKRPYHTEKIGKKAGSIELDGPVYNFPIFQGAVIDGMTFEPLCDATVTLKINDNKAIMTDMTWTNPCKTFKSTNGNYSYWVKPETAEKAGETKKFTFTIEVECEGYKGTVYSFDYSCVSETADRSKINSLYSLKIQDLFLFKNEIENPME